MTPNNTTSLYRLQLVREADYPYETGTLSCSATAAKFFRPLFEGIDREQMAVAFLDAKHRVIGVGIVSIGSLTASIVHPREVFKPAMSGSSGVALATMEGKLETTAKSKLTVSAKNIKINAKTTIDIKAGGDLTLEASGSAKVTSGSPSNYDAPSIDIA